MMATGMEKLTKLQVASFHRGVGGIRKIELRRYRVLVRSWGNRVALCLKRIVCFVDFPVGN